MRAYVYVDGFNLYYGLLKKSPHKWLDLNALCRMLLPEYYVLKIKYFTALVNYRESNPHAHERQRIYLRALRTLPNVEVILGHFLTHPVNMVLESPLSPEERIVRVLKSEEKGSDVNMASHLLLDGFRDRYDVAVVLSNDSDLGTPIAMVKDELNKKVGLLNPQKRPSMVLLELADFIRKVRSGVLEKCQFPQKIKDINGSVRKPKVWNDPTP